MNERYDQPFFVPHRMAKRLGWAHAGYLPALEQPSPVGDTPLPPNRENFLLGYNAYLQHKLEKKRHRDIV